MFKLGFQLDIDIKELDNTLKSFLQTLIFDNSLECCSSSDNIWLDYLTENSQKFSSFKNNIWGWENTLITQSKITLDSTFDSMAVDRTIESADFYENLEWQDTCFRDFFGSLVGVEKEFLTWNRLYVFGDSLSDTGNVFNLTEGQFPSFPYVSGRFSDGDLWVDYLTEELDLESQPFTSINNNLKSNDSFGLNFAIAGATSGDKNVGIIPLGLEQQIDNFKLQKNKYSNDDLFALWIGANDYFSFIEDDLTTPKEIETNFPDRKELTNTVINIVNINIDNAIQELIEAGGSNIIIFNLPSLDKTPLAQNLTKKDRSILQELTSNHNKYLSDFIEETKIQYPNINIVDINVFQLFEEITNKPQKFEFDVTDNYTGIDLYTENNSSAATGSSEEYLFFDSVHLTTTAQSLVADLVIEELDQKFS